MNRKAAIVPVFLAFLAMGFGDAVGPFVSLAREKFQLSNFMAQMIPFVGFAMFGVLSIPMGVYQDQKGKKYIIMLGLCVMLAGILIIAFSLSLLIYWFRYSCILILRNQEFIDQSAPDAVDTRFTFVQVRDRIETANELDPMHDRAKASGHRIGDRAG